MYFGGSVLYIGDMINENKKHYVLDERGENREQQGYD